MKKITTVLFLACNMVCFGQGSNLIVFSSGGEKFTLYVNGVRTNDNPESNVKAVGINADIVKIKVAFAGDVSPEITKSVMLYDETTTPPVEVTYELKPNKKGTYNLQLTSSTPLEQRATSSTTPGVSADVKTVETTTQLVSMPAPVATTAVSVSGNTSGSTANTDGASLNLNIKGSGEKNVSLNMSVNVDGGGQTKTAPTITAPPTSYTISKVKDGLMCASPSVNAQDFLKAKYKIESSYLDFGRRDDSKKFMETNCMLASQVAELVKTAQMNENQIDIAKFGYLHTFDQANYGAVVLALAADYNKDELIRFIGQQNGGSTSPTQQKPQQLRPP